MSRSFQTPFLLSGDPVFENEERRREIYARVFGTYNGRMVLADILVRGGCGSAAFRPGTAPADAAYYSGLHASALGIAETAGLDLGKIGAALVQGTLESMITGDPNDDDHDRTDHDDDSRSGHDDSLER